MKKWNARSVNNAATSKREKEEEERGKKVAVNLEFVYFSLWRLTARSPCCCCFALLYSLSTRRRWVICGERALKPFLNVLLFASLSLSRRGIFTGRNAARALSATSDARRRAMHQSTYTRISLYCIIEKKSQKFWNKRNIFILSIIREVNAFALLRGWIKRNIRWVEKTGLSPTNAALYKPYK